MKKYTGYYIAASIVLIAVVLVLWVFTVNLLVKEGPQIVGQVAAQVHNAYAKEAK
jgi:hypothetical protein